MKNILFLLFFAITFVVISCKETKIVSVNKDFVITQASKKNVMVNGLPGAELQFTVVTLDQNTINSVHYWEGNHSLDVIKESGDTSWLSTTIRKPVLAKETINEEELSVVRPIDSTCYLIYIKDAEEFTIPIYSLKKLK